MAQTKSRHSITEGTRSERLNVQSEWLDAIGRHDTPPEGAFSPDDVAQQARMTRQYARSQIARGVASGEIRCVGRFRCADGVWRKHYVDAKE